MNSFNKESPTGAFLFYVGPVKPVPTCLIGIICSFTLMLKQFCVFSWYANV